MRVTFEVARRCIECRVRFWRVSGEVASRKVGLVEGAEMERGLGEEKLSGIGGNRRGEVHKVSEESKVKDREGKRLGARLMSISSVSKG